MHIADSLDTPYSAYLIAEVRYNPPRGSHQGAIISMDSLQPHQQMAPPIMPTFIAPRPYLPPEMGYPDPNTMPHLPKMPIHQNKFAPKRSIKMPRRDTRGPKMVRSTVDGIHYTLARMDDHGMMTINGYPATMAPEN